MDCGEAGVHGLFCGVAFALLIQFTKDGGVVHTRKYTKLASTSCSLRIIFRVRGKTVYVCQSRALAAACQESTKLYLGQEHVLDYIDANVGVLTCSTPPP